MCSANPFVRREFHYPHFAGSFFGCVHGQRVCVCRSAHPASHMNEGSCRSSRVPCDRVHLSVWILTQRTSGQKLAEFCFDGVDLVLCARCVEYDGEYQPPPARLLCARTPHLLLAFQSYLLI